MRIMATDQQRYDAMAQSVKTLENRIRDLERLIATLEAEKRQWVMEKLMQEQVIKNTLTSANATSHSYLEENKKLKEENAQLRAMKADYLET